VVDSSSPAGLSRALSHRQIQMMAIGGAIGVGLFLGSASAIHEAGPSVLLCYVVAGVVVFLMLRALGEMAVNQPVAGSFATYAEQMIGPRTGYATGWVYCLMWLTTAMAEITAIGIYFQYFADVPQWLPALVAVVLVLGANLVSAHLFGSLEFGFALIKIVAILAFILSGVVILVFGVGDLQRAAASNLWDRGGFFPEGVGGTLIALQIVTYAFAGVEMIGVTAGEAQNPQRDLPLAINRVAWRILIFYVGAILIVLMLIPWDRITPGESPFVTAWEALGVPAAGAVLTVVVLSSALSSCNSGIFTSARMLWSMSDVGEAPRPLHTLSRAHVPARALVVCGAVLVIGVVLNAVIPDQAFTYITSVATVAVLWVWGVIAVTHLRFRARVRRGDLTSAGFRMPGAPWTNLVVLAYIAVVVVLLAITPDQRVALAAGAVVAVLLGAGWRWLVLPRRRATEAAG
jgi:AAT family amino acid transporter/D-serine/D-alanine/glycine transporter